MQPRKLQCCIYEETQSNRVSDFRDFVYSLFPKAILFDFYVSSKCDKYCKKNVHLLRRRKLNRSDGFLLWTVLKCKIFPSTN